MGPKRSPSPEMLVGTSLGGSLGCSPYGPPRSWDITSLPPLSFTAPLLNRFGFADQQKKVAVQWQSVDHGRRVAGPVTRSSAASLQPQAFV